MLIDLVSLSWCAGRVISIFSLLVNLGLLLENLNQEKLEDGSIISNFQNITELQKLDNFLTWNLTLLCEELLLE